MVEIPELGKLMDTLVKQVFPKHISEDRVPPIFGWTGVAKDVDLPYNLVVEVPQEHIANEENYLNGAVAVNEWMTNVATNTFFRRLLKAPFLSDPGIVSLYTGMLDKLTYGLVFSKIYKKMNYLRVAARFEQIDFDDAILNSLFKGDNALLDKLIMNAFLGEKIIDYHSLMVHIGKDPTSKIFGEMITRDESKLKNLLKNIMVANMAFATASLYNPGIIQIYPNLILAAPLVTAGLLSISTAPTTLLAMGSFVPYLLIHETLHYYEADKHHFGPLSARLVRKEEL